MIGIDTNILVHAHRRDASLHREANDCVRKLAEGRHPWGICFHSLVEFYGIATHRKIWSQASTPSEAQRQINAWKKAPTLHILTESAEHIAPLLELANSTKVVGPMVHDARIASCFLSHGISELWTIDRDFSRFSDLKTRNPLT